MPDLNDGETFEMQGSASKPYQLRNTGGVYSCTCPAWRNQSVAIERRTCKHLQKLRGKTAEAERVGAASKGVAEQAPEADTDEAAGPPLLLAERWDNVADLAGWWMSEKLDGVRAYWDGKMFLSRLGNQYHAPEWFLAQLPAEPLDGELWVGRKQFQQTVSIVRRQDRGQDWKKVRFLVFDLPAMKAPFEERMERCRALLQAARPPHAELHPHAVCAGTEALRAELARIEARGGEGLMLRQPRSEYVVGRSSTLLKVKSFHDEEAIVVGHVAGAGRHQGRLGALEVELANGTRFSIGTGFSDAERRSPPPIGAVVTFRYQELSNAGVPRFPSFQGVRHDVQWTGQTPSRAG